MTAVGALPRGGRTAEVWQVIREEEIGLRWDLWLGETPAGFPHWTPASTFVLGGAAASLRNCPSSLRIVVRPTPPTSLNNVGEEAPGGCLDRLSTVQVDRLLDGRDGTPIRGDARTRRAIVAEGLAVEVSSRVALLTPIGERAAEMAATLRAEARLG